MDASNDVVRAEVRRLRSIDGGCGFAIVPMGTAEGLQGDMRARCGADNAAFINGEGELIVALKGQEHALINADRLKIKGAHNAGNALAAAAAALAAGASDEAVCEALATFSPLEHRIELCGTVRGAECYNDSKATNVDATLKALAAFPHTRPIVLLGGDDKGTDLADLVAAAHAHTRAVVCFGAAAPASSRRSRSKVLRRRQISNCSRRTIWSLRLTSRSNRRRLGKWCCFRPPAHRSTSSTPSRSAGEVFKKLVAARAAKLGA